MIEYGAIHVSIAQESNLKFGRKIIVERESGTVSYTIIRWIEVHLAHQILRNLPCSRCFCWQTIRGSCLIKHAFCIKIIAVLHHLYQYLVDGMRTCASQFA